MIVHELMSEPGYWFHMLHLVPVLLPSVLILVDARPDWTGTDDTAQDFSKLDGDGY